MPETRIVVWDIDRVWYPDISTTYTARGSTADPEPYLRDFVERGWFSYEHVDQWRELTGRKTDSVGALAEMLTDFLYRPELRNTVYAGVSDQEAKSRTINGKQSLLKGLTIGDVKRIADSVPDTEGLKRTIRAIKEAGIYQVGFSDGLGPFTAYKMKQQGIEIGGIVPAQIEYSLGNRDLWFNVNNALDFLSFYYDGEELLGVAGEFRKSNAIFEYLQRNSYQLSEAAAIDDSAANIATLAKIRDGGGIAVGFNVNDAKKFEDSKIPIIKGKDLRPFAEIVVDRGKTREFCETWDVDT